MEWLTQLLDKASPQDIVALGCSSMIVWLVATKRQIARHTVELAIKLLAGIVGGTVLARLAMAYLLTLN